ncbi:hypothetical protein LMG26691_04167 [Achromobacter animicus]|nr:hypothetical protein LMG26691_04167 [Achromobacter animicus]
MPTSAVAPASAFVAAGVDAVATVFAPGPASVPDPVLPASIFAWVLGPGGAPTAASAPAPAPVIVPSAPGAPVTLAEEDPTVGDTSAPGAAVAPATEPTAGAVPAVALPPEAAPAAALVPAMPAPADGCTLGSPALCGSPASCGSPAPCGKPAPCGNPTPCGNPAVPASGTKPGVCIEACGRDVAEADETSVAGSIVASLMTASGAEAGGACCANVPVEDIAAAASPCVGADTAAEKSPVMAPLADIPDAALPEVEATEGRSEAPGRPPSTVDAEVSGPAWPAADAVVPSRLPAPAANEASRAAFGSAVVLAVLSR